MNTFLQVVGSMGLVAVALVLLRAWRAVRATTLRAAWFWAAAACAAWIAVWTATLTAEVTDGVADQLWYGVAVLALCPPIAVLGARRPGVRAWSWFVVVPLVLVFAWPALTQWNTSWELDPLQVEVPMIIGYALVLLMGLGNYVGTRLTPAALLLGAAQLLIVAPLSTAVPNSFPEAEPSRLWATNCLSASAIVAWLLACRDAKAATGLERIWFDFQNWFGIVWARRFMDRVNETSQRENWPVRLEIEGFRPEPASKASVVQAEHTQRVEHTFRWLLRRFVDPEWIDARMEPRQRLDQPTHSASRTN